MLRISEADGFFTSRTGMTVVLEYEGFDIPLLDDTPELSRFCVNTYHTFYSQGSDVAYKVVNAFFETLSIEDQKEMASAYVLCNGFIKRNIVDVRELECIVEACEEVITDIDKGIDLCAKIDKFTRDCVDSNVFQIVDMSNAGNRAHDRKDMTFHRPDAIFITAMSILSKMFSPVIGEIIARHGQIGSNYKEAITSRIFTSVYRKHYYQISKRLHHYISALVGAKPRTDAGAYITGITSTSVVMNLEANLKTKKFVITNCYAQDSNIIKDIASLVRSNMDNHAHNSNSWAVKLFSDPKEDSSVSGNEETNSSRIEVETSCSKKPMVVEPLVRFASGLVIKNLIDDGSLNKEIYYETREWYHKNPMILTNISMFIVSTYLSRHLGGGKSIFLLEEDSLTDLAVAMQVMLATGTGYINMIQACTMKMMMEERVSSTEDFSFINKWKSLPEYTALRKVVPSGFGNVQWDTMFKTIAQSLATKYYAIHLAPTVRTLIEENQLVHGNVANNGDHFGDDIDYFGDNISLMGELLQFTKDNWDKYNPLL